MTDQAKEKKPASNETKQNGHVGHIETEGLSAPVQPGRLTDCYDVQKAVGKGGYAIVYKGIRREDGRVVAVKKVEIFEMSQKKRERCLQEVSLLQQLNHPNIIQMLDAFIDDNMLIIIFEWAPAGDLKRLIKKTAEAGKTLDEAAIWNFFAQITDGLRYMHQQRIMHRDIKPANVLVGANGALKLGDLGLGRQLSEQTMEAFSKVGTPYYVSPEVVQGLGYDWKSDVWSMGCLLFELACLRSPFEMEGANLYDVFQRISKGNFNPLPQDQFSAPLRDLVSRMLMVDPAKRPDLEEVWTMTRNVTASQARSRQDVHCVSEAVWSSLRVLEGEVTSRLASREGRRGSSLTAAPTSALRIVHPLYFAEAENKSSESDSGRQLGVFLLIFAWIMRLNNKLDIAQTMESFVVVPGDRSSSRSSSRSVKSPSSPQRHAHRPSATPTPPLNPTVPQALKGADAAKRAAQALGLSTEFAPVSALATGFGRSVCVLLQDALETTYKRLSITCKLPPPQVVKQTDEATELDCLEDESCLIEVPDGTLEVEDEAYFTLDSGGGHSSSAQAGTNRDGDGQEASEQQTRVDPAAWMAEVERLRPQLSKIRITSDRFGDWNQRWEKAKSGIAEVAQEGPSVTTSLVKLSSQISDQIERIDVAERNVNNIALDSLARYRAVHAQLQSLTEFRNKHEDLISTGNAALNELAERQTEVEVEIGERMASLDGATAIKQMQDAIRKLANEVKAMDLKLGVVHHAVLQRQLTSKRARITAAGAEEPSS